MLNKYLDLIEERFKSKEIERFLDENGFYYIKDVESLINTDLSEKEKFIGFWDNLILDENYINYTYRKRRILRYKYLYGSEIIINKDSSYDSSVTYDIDYVRGQNKLTYAEDGFVYGDVINELIKIDLAFLDCKLKRNKQYIIDIHQFRVEANFGKPSPTTSGIHQDGLDWIVMHFIKSSNILPVISEVFSSKNESDVLMSKSMSSFLETIIVSDKSHYHRATPVRQYLMNQPAYRDLLLVTFRQI